MKKLAILVLMPTMAGAALFASVPTASAAVSDVPFRVAALGAFSDAECGSLFMTANPEVMKSSAPVYASSLKKPSVTSCIVLQSYLYSSAMALKSHEVVATESAELTNPYQFENSLLAKFKKEKNDVASSTFAWEAIDPKDDGSTMVTPSSTWTLTDGTLKSVHTHGDAATTTLKDGTVVNTYDMIDHVTNLKSVAGLVYRAQKGSDWYVVALGKESQAWKSVDQLTVDESGSSAVIVYRAQAKDDSWHIVKNDKVYDLAWKPLNVAINPVTHEPFAGDLTGRFWTPAKERKYPNAPRVQGVDSMGRFLITTLSYPDMDLKQLWVDYTPVTLFTIANQYHDAAPSFTNERSASVYFPGYVMTFDKDITFNAQNEIVIYRQEGRVFTRSVYQVK